jgi:myo-inositol-1(or 4)-monophosphatase
VRFATRNSALKSRPVVPSDLVRSIVLAAEAGASVLLHYFERLESLAVRAKGPGDLVSAADVSAQDAILATLTRTDASARFQAEELESGQATTGPRYIVDPLDGTLNFLRGIPHFSVSIAYADAGGVRAGVVLDPIRRELFWAEHGQGAFLGERALKLGPGAGLADSSLHCGLPQLSRPNRERYVARLARLMNQTASTRRLGSAALALAYVAAGRADAFFEPGLGAWDLAAGLVLVREAGGIVTDLAGGDAVLESGDVLAATRTLHPLLLANFTREEGS